MNFKTVFLETLKYNIYAQKNRKKVELTQKPVKLFFELKYKSFIS